MAVHEGIRKYNCEYCPKNFAHREGMMNHIRAIHEGIRFNCDVCGKSFTQSHNLKMHVKNSHPHLAKEVKKYINIVDVGPQV